jgi:hypothetical protein
MPAKTPRGLSVHGREAIECVIAAMVMSSAVLFALPFRMRDAQGVAVLSPRERLIAAEDADGHDLALSAGSAAAERSYEDIALGPSETEAEELIDVEPGPTPREMFAHREPEAVAADGLAPCTDYVALRPVIDCVPALVLRVPAIENERRAT